MFVCVCVYCVYNVCMNERCMFVVTQVYVMCLYERDVCLYVYNVCVIYVYVTEKETHVCVRI